MRKQCPECKEFFKGYSCECGYKIKGAPTVPTKEQVSVKLSSGSVCYVSKCEKRGCQNPGTITQSIGHKTSSEAKWYCRDHFNKIEKTKGGE